MSVFPRYPRIDGVVESIAQNLEETEWEGDGELDGREAHEAEVAIGINVRDLQIEELLERLSAFEKGAKGEDSVGAGDEGEDARPYPDKWESKRSIIHGGPTTQALDNVGAVTLNDVI